MPQRLTISERGLLENLKTEPASRRTVPPGWVEIQVDAAGLNFRDVLSALGMYAGEPGPLGSECVGRIVALGKGVTQFQEGDEVLTMAPGGHDGFVIADARIVVRKPASLTLEQAATLPTAFLTARYTLETLARIRRGDRVLIHAATGGVGLAAVQIAKRAGAEIFATAGSAKKRELLQTLGVSHVFDSRTPSFTRDILEQTDGQGVDIVLNSLTGEFIAASFSVLARGGRFIEIGKKGIWTQEQVDELGRRVEYHVVDLGQTAVDAPETLGWLLQNTVDLILQGELNPLPAKTYSVRQAPDAFRYMAQAQHIGKIVLREDTLGARISPSATYLITGGFGALGAHVARWLVEQGAQHIVLAGRSKPAGPASECMEWAARRGAQVISRKCDVSEVSEIRALLSDIEANMPPLRGVVHAAGVIDDGILGQQSWERFEKVMAPKVAGSWVLHQLTAGLSLEFFVFFSSVAALIGAPGQSNYAAANAFEDALAHARRAQGLPATSINWGAWSEGLAASDLLEKRRESLGMTAMKAEEALGLFKTLLLAGPVQAGAGFFDWNKFIGRYPAGAPKRFSNLLSTKQSARAAEDGASSSLLDQLSGAPVSRSQHIIRDFVHQLAIRVLGFTATRRIDPEEALNNLGLDSLMAVEFRNALATATRTSLPATLLFSYPSIEAVTGFVYSQVVGADEEKSESSPRKRGDVLENIEDLSDEEVDRMLAQKLGGS